MLGFQFKPAHPDAYNLPFPPIDSELQARAMAFCQDVERQLQQLHEPTYQQIDSAITDQLSRIGSYLKEKGKSLPEKEQKLLADLAQFAFFPEGPLRSLLKDPQLEEVTCNGLGPENPVFVFSRTSRSFLPTNLYFTDFDQLRTMINNLTALHAGRRMDLSHPYVMALVELYGQKFRFTAVQERATSTSRIQFAIRKYSTDIYTPLDLIYFKTLDHRTAAFLWLVFQVGARINLLVVGRPASGKTTFLQSMSLFMPDNQRIIDAEYQPELRLLQSNVAGLMSRPEEGLGMDTLIGICERYRPDRLIIGEVVSREEIRSLLDAAGRATGDGIYATYHANSAQAALQTMYLNTRDQASPSDLAHLGLVATVWPMRYLQNGKEIFERRLVDISEVTPKLKDDLPVLRRLVELKNFKLEWNEPSGYAWEQLSRYFGSEQKLKGEWEQRTRVLEHLTTKRPDAATFYRFVQQFTKDTVFRNKVLGEMGISL